MAAKSRAPSRAKRSPWWPPATRRNAAPAMARADVLAHREGDDLVGVAVDDERRDVDLRRLRQGVEPIGEQKARRARRDPVGHEIGDGRVRRDEHEPRAPPPARHLGRDPRAQRDAGQHDPIRDRRRGPPACRAPPRRRGRAPPPTGPVAAGRAVPAVFDQEHAEPARSEGTREGRGRLDRLAVVVEVHDRPGSRRAPVARWRAPARRRWPRARGDEVRRRACDGDLGDREEIGAREGPGPCPEPAGRKSQHQRESRPLEQGDRSSPTDRSPRQRSAGPGEPIRSIPAEVGSSACYRLDR